MINRNKLRRIARAKIKSRLSIKANWKEKGVGSYIYIADNNMFQVKAMYTIHDDAVYWSVDVAFSGSDDWQSSNGELYPDKVDFNDSANVREAVNAKVFRILDGFAAGLQILAKDFS